MKRIISILLVLTIMATLSACLPSTKEEPATVTDNYGNTAQYTSYQIRSVYNENEAKFEDQFVGAKITLTDTIYSIETTEKYFVGGIGDVGFYKITLKRSWEVLLVSSEHPEVIDLKKGDKIQVISKIDSSNSYDVILGDYSVYSSSLIGDSTEITVIEKAN